MKTFRILVDYPLFRLLIFLMTGMAVFHQVSYLPESWKIAWGGFVGAWVGCILVYRMKSRRGTAFSCCAFAACFFMGGLLILHRYQCQYENWSSRDCLYKGVIETITERENRYQLELKVSEEIGNREAQNYCRKIEKRIRLTVWKDSVQIPFSIGTSLHFYGKISPLVKQPVFVGFDYHSYLWNKGMSGLAQVQARQVKVVQSEMADDWQIRLNQYRRQVAAYIHQWGLSDKVEPIVVALTIGEKRMLDDSIKSMYQEAGVAHLLAISGLHVGILTACLLFVLRVFRRFRWGRAGEILFVNTMLWGFVFLSGAGVSVVRAVSMYNLYSVGRFITEGNRAGFCSLTLAAWGILLVNPYALFDVSFQLSFAAVLSILLFLPLLNDGIGHINRWGRYLLTLVGLSLAAQLWVTPLIIHYFGSFPLYFLPVNVIVVPWMGVVMGLILLTFITFPFGAIGGLTVYLVDCSIGIMHTFLELVVDLPSAQIEGLRMDVWQIIGWTACVVCLMAFRRSSHRIIGSLIVLNGLLAYTTLHRYSSHTQGLYCYDGAVYQEANGVGKRVKGEHQLYQVGDIRVGVFKNAYWQYKETGQRLVLNYAYVCDGYRGDLDELLRLFEVRRILLDTNLDETVKESMIEACKTLKIPYSILPDRGYYRISN